jgi:5-methylcytosine-specific restriction enzyme subunit McrC
MYAKTKPIPVFEWESLRVGEKGFTQRHFESLVLWQDRQPDTYFNVGHNKVTFQQWVGVIQVGQLVIEVLPKVANGKGTGDSSEKARDVSRWKGVLVDMLRRTGRLKVRIADDADLALRRQSLLDLYFQSYLDEVEHLMHLGLVKKYRREARNRTALKGKLLFQRQAEENLLHGERFYCEASEYDRQNVWNEILLAGLRVSSGMAQDGLIKARAKNLELSFPDWPEHRYQERDFDRLRFDRKTRGYEPAVILARLILLHLNPQTSAGRDRVVAILFDMNSLWEDWLLATYRASYRGNPDVRIPGKKSQVFWAAESGGTKWLETDILVEAGGRKMVLDAKWKRPDRHPADADLKQMFTYNLMWKSQEAWLVYPKVRGAEDRSGSYSLGEAGRLGMTFAEVFDETGLHLNKRLSLPKFPE